MSRVTPIDVGIPDTIQKRIVKDLDKAYFPDTMIVPYMDVVHDRITLEIFRGCTRAVSYTHLDVYKRQLIAQVEKPVRYMGNEYNIVVKDTRKVDIRFAFAFPDVYEAVSYTHLYLFRNC